jgi:uncharacterized protein (TIGR03382 family)
VSTGVQIGLTIAVGVALLVLAVALVRRRLLAVRYGLGWISVGVAIIVVAPFLAFVPSIARWLGFTPTGLLLGLSVVFLGLVCMQLSISISGLAAAIQNLSERSALVEQRVTRLEELVERADSQVSSGSPTGGEAGD